MRAHLHHPGGLDQPMPSSQTDNGAGKKLIWSSKGILIWFRNDQATQIVVFRKQ